MTIGKRLKKAIKERGLTQQELARLTGFRQSDFSDWVNDARTPRPEALAKIASALEMSVEELIADEPFGLSPIDQQLLSLPQADKKLALDFLAFLRSRRPKIGD
ncbi:hypothetical protein MASR1M12_01230 [Erysipelotrichia bacterium]